MLETDAVKLYVDGSATFGYTQTFGAGWVIVRGEEKETHALGMHLRFEWNRAVDPSRWIPSTAAEIMAAYYGLMSLPEGTKVHLRLDHIDVLNFLRERKSSPKGARTTFEDVRDIYPSLHHFWDQLAQAKERVNLLDVHIRSDSNSPQMFQAHQASIFASGSRNYKFSGSLEDEQESHRKAKWPPRVSSRAHKL